MSLKNIILKNIKFTSWLTRKFCRNNVQIVFPELLEKKNKIVLSGVFSERSSIIVNGRGNKIEIGRKTFLKNCHIYISGSNCKVIIGENCRLSGVSLWIEDDGGCITIGSDCRFHGNCHFATTEGKNISIGNSCLFSNQISLRTGDSHSIVDIITNTRINSAADITIGSNVWVGNDVKILKGSTINESSVVATGAIITSGLYPSNVIIGGIGGKILKENITWFAERL